MVTAAQPGLAMAVGARMLSADQRIEQRDEEREETTMGALVGASTGSFATSSSSPSLAPTDSLDSRTGHIRRSDGHVPGPHRRRVLRPGPVGDAA